MSKSTLPKRFTFTFSNSSGLDVVVQNLEQRLSGLSRAEIVKLALIEFNYRLQRQDSVLEKVEFLTEAEEDSLLEAMKSDSVLFDSSKGISLGSFLDQEKLKYV